MKYSFLMPYFNRFKQLGKTYETFQVAYGHRDDFEVVLVVDPKSEEECPALMLLNDEQSFPVQMYLLQGDQGLNPSVHFNMASRLATGDYFILTSPEVLHETDVLAGFDEEFEKDPHCYVVAACRGLTADGEFWKWYQHSIYRPANYHWCTAIYRTLYKAIGGFDERYKEGVAYDDDDLVEAIKHLGVPFVVRDDLLTSHQWHGKAKEGTRERRDLVAKNKRLFESKWGVQNV